MQTIPNRKALRKTHDLETLAEFACMTAYTFELVGRGSKSKFQCWRCSITLQEKYLRVMTSSCLPTFRKILLALAQCPCEPDPVGSPDPSLAVLDGVRSSSQIGRHCQRVETLSWPQSMTLVQCCLIQFGWNASLTIQC